MRLRVSRVIALHGLEYIWHLTLQILRLARIAAQVVQMPLAIAHRHHVLHQFQIALEQRQIARQLIADGLIGRVHLLRLTFQHRQQTASHQGLNRLTPVAVARVRDAGQLKQGGRNVGHVRQAAVHLVLPSAGHAGDDQRRADAALTRIELVAAQRRSRSAGPTRPRDGVSALVAQFFEGL